MPEKKCLITEENKREITWNLINAGLAGFLVLLGSFATGNITWEGFAIAIIASLVVVATKFKEYWDGEKQEYTTKLFSFIA